MKEFNIRDRVRYLFGDHPTGEITAKTTVGSWVHYTVKWDSGKLDEHGWNESIEKIPEPELVHDPTKFKVGDRVRLKLNGREYVVEKVTGYFTFLEGCGGWYSYNLEKVMEEPKFKVGDYVAVKKLNNNPRKILKVTTFHDYLLEYSDCPQRYSELELAKIEKKEKPIFKPKFKIGDRVYAEGFYGNIEEIYFSHRRYKVRYEKGTWDNLNEQDIMSVEEVWE